MEGISLVFSIIAVALIIYWAWKNDRVPLGGKTSGMLAMRDREPAARRERDDGDDGQEAGDGDVTDSRHRP